MATMKHIKAQIKSVANLKKMTRALEVVSTVKLQKIKHKTEQYRNFFHEFLSIAKIVHDKVDLFPETKKMASGKTLLIVLSTDKGLCGPINSKLFKTIFAEYAESKDVRKSVDVFCVGKKSLDFFVRTGFSTVGTLQVKDDFEGTDLSPLYTFLSDVMTKNMYSNIKVCFNYFQNAIKQTPVMVDLFPFNKASIDQFIEQIDVDVNVDQYLSSTKKHTDLAIEPSVECMRKEIMSQFMQHLIYGAVLQNKAGEFSARMIAMKNAKDNATGLMKDLKLQFNKARQSAITQEISEIVSAKMAIESFN